MEASTALHAALWPYVADLAPRRPQPSDPANIANLLGGTGAMADAAGYHAPGRRPRSPDAVLRYVGGRREAADRAGLVGRDRANFLRATLKAERGGRLAPRWAGVLRQAEDRQRRHDRRERQSALERYRRWINTGHGPADSAEWRRLREAAAARRSQASAGDRKRQLDTLSSMVGDAGLLIRRVEGTIRVSNDERNRYLDLRHWEADDEDEPGERSGGLYLAPDELEGQYGPHGEDFYQALGADDWDTAAICVLSSFMEKYTGGATAGEPAFGTDIDLLEVEIP